MEPVFVWAMAGAASAHQAATASREDTSQQRAGRRRRTSADPQRDQQGATAAAAAPAALESLSRLQRLADASPRVAQLRRLQALADGRFAPVAQLAGDPEEEELIQGKFASTELQPQLQQAPRANNTGLPDQLKSGIESLSGLSMDDVRVHYNSSQPAQLNALAYAQGNDIHLAPGQERHLPHEAWHVVQQAQGRVRPTLQMKEGVQVNDDAGLEREADVMGPKALEAGHGVAEAHRPISLDIKTALQFEGDTANSSHEKVANNDSAPLANGRDSVQRGWNEVQRIANQRPDAALQQQVQAWGDGSERVGQLRAWQEVADGRGVGGKRQDLTAGFVTPGFALTRVAPRQSTRVVQRVMTLDNADFSAVNEIKHLGGNAECAYLVSDGIGKLVLKADTGIDSAVLAYNLAKDFKLTTPNARYLTLNGSPGETLKQKAQTLCPALYNRLKGKAAVTLWSLVQGGTLADLKMKGSDDKKSFATNENAQALGRMLVFDAAIMNGDRFKIEYENTPPNSGNLMIEDNKPVAIDQDFAKIELNSKPGEQLVEYGERFTNLLKGLLNDPKVFATKFCDKMASEGYIFFSDEKQKKQVVREVESGITNGIDILRQLMNEKNPRLEKLVQWTKTFKSDTDVTVDKIRTYWQGLLN
jgi:hypothetical protein